MKKELIFKVVILIFFCVKELSCIDNGAGRTPPMGWSSKGTFNCSITENIVKQMADRMIDRGLASKGYSFVNIDDCWQASRNQSTGEILEDLLKFPHGMWELSKYIHSKGLKLGLYSDLGNKTCNGRPGSFGYEKIDAVTYANWSVDYLKYDNCNNDTNSTKLRYYAMEKWLNETGRSVFYSIGTKESQRAWEWGSSVANAWQTNDGLQDKWSSFLNVLEKQVGLEKYGQKGGWNDPGLLQVGNGLMSFEEYQSQFVFWCGLKAPLILTCDLNSIPSQILDLVTNEELIAINQDSLSVGAGRIKSEIGSGFKREVWGGPLSNNSYLLIFFNRGQQQTTISVSLSKDIPLKYSSYTMRDPVRRKSSGATNVDLIQMKVSPHKVEVRVLGIMGGLIRKKM